MIIENFNLIIKTLWKALKKCAFLIAFLILMIITMILMAYLNIFGNIVYFGFMMTFLLMSYLLFNLAHVFHHELMIVTHFNMKNKKILSFGVSVITITFISLIGNFHIHFINNYINPPLETCSYYDLYGNNLVDFNTYSTDKCNILKNETYEFDEQTNLKSLSFDLTLEPMNYHFDYFYENQKITKIIKHEYLTSRFYLDNIYFFDTGILFKHKSEEINYQYQNHSLVINQKNMIYHLLTDLPLMKTYEQTTTVTNENNQLNIKEEYNYDLVFLDEMDHLINEQYINYIKNNYSTYASCADGFCLDKLNENDINEYIQLTKEKYKNNPTLNTEIRNLDLDNNEILYSILPSKYSLTLDNDRVIKKIYSNYKNLDEEYTYKKLKNGLFVISDYKNYMLEKKPPYTRLTDLYYYDYNNQYSYEILESNDGVLKKIDQYKNHQLSYRHIVTNLTYGYKINHYYYQKTGLLKFKDRNDPYSNDYCFNNKNIQQFIYGNVVNPIYSDHSYDGCGADLFYSNDILFDYLYRS